MFPEREAALACLSNEWVHWLEKDKGWGKGQNLWLTLIEEMSQSLLTKSWGWGTGRNYGYTMSSYIIWGRETHTHTRTHTPKPVEVP